jgi:putative peptidoglycan lipid II flippase
LKLDYEIFLIGAVLPNVINTIIYFIGQNFFIPAYNKLKIKEVNRLNIFFVFSFWTFICIGIIIALSGYLFSDQVINYFLSGFSNELKKEAVKILYLFLLTIPLTSVISIISAYLQAEFEFKLPIFSQIIPNIFVICMVIFLTRNLGVYAIPIGILLGTAFQAFVLILRIKDKIHFFKVKDISKEFFLSFNNVFLLTIIIEVMGQLYIVIDRFFYTKVEPGSIAALNYATGLYSLPILIFSMAFSTAIFPKFSQTFYQDSTEDFGNALVKGVNVITFVFIPLTIIFILGGNLIVGIVYQRGSFNFNDTEMTFSLLRILSFSLLFYSVYSVLYKALYSAGKVKFLCFLQVGGIILKILLSVLLISSLKQAGLALSTSITYIIFCLFSLTYILMKIKFTNKVKLFKEFLISLLNGFFSISIVLILIKSFAKPNPLLFMISGILFLSIYLLNSIFLQQDAIKSLSYMKIEIKSILNKFS